MNRIMKILILFHLLLKYNFNHSSIQNPTNNKRAHYNRIVTTAFLHDYI